MLSENGVTSIIAVHAGVKEKAEVLKGLLPIIGKTTVWMKIEDILAYFNQDVRRHFMEEELLLAMVRKEVSFLPGDDEMLSGIMGEHVGLLEQLAKINGIAGRYDYDNREIRENFVGLANDLIESLIEHADKEDRQFFPLIEEKISDARLREIVEIVVVRNKREKGAL